MAFDCTMTSESEFGKSASLDSGCNDLKNAYDVGLLSTLLVI